MFLTLRTMGVVCVLGFVAACSGGDGEGDGDGNRNGGAPADIAGVWTITETYLTDSCEGPGGSDTYRVTVTQTGNAVTLMFDDGTTYDGTINGNTLTWSGSYPEEGGTTTVSGEFIVSADERSLQGSDSWTWTDGSTTCSGTDSFTGTRETGGNGGGNGGGGNAGAIDSNEGLGAMMQVIALDFARILGEIAPEPGFFLAPNTGAM